MTVSQNYGRCSCTGSNTCDRKGTVHMEVHCDEFVVVVEGMVYGFLTLPLEPSWLSSWLVL